MSADSSEPMKASEILYLSREDVERVGLPMEDIVTAVEAMFVEKAAGRTQMPPKPGVHPTRDGFIHAMPAYVPAASAAGLKWVAAYPENKEKGLPYVSGLIVMNDPSTGLPRAVMDCAWITAMRTGAATAVAARHLARPDSSTVGIVACGVQGRSNLEALACVMDIARVHAYDHRPTNSERYAREMRESLGLDVRPVERLEEAVRDMDVVVTSGPILKEPDPPIPAGWLSRGAFACTLDFDSYWSGAALAQSDRLVSDDVEQLDYYRTLGYFRNTPSGIVELADVVTGTVVGREHHEARIISVHLGLALEDVVTATRVVDRALAQGIGTRLPM